MTTQKQLKDFTGSGKLAAEYFSSLKQMQDDFMKSRQDLLSGFSVSDSLNNGFASDSSATLNRNASIDTDTMNAAAQKILDAKAAKAKQYSYSTNTPEEPPAYDLSYFQTLEQQAKDNLDSAQQALSIAQSVLEQTPGTGIMIGKYAKTYADEYTNANNDLSAAQENYNQAQSAYAQAKADRESFEAASLGTVNGLAVSTDRSLSDIEADLNAAGSYIEDLDQWVAKPGQSETLNNLLYEQRLAWAQQAESVNQTYTKGDQITAATAASFGDGLDQFDTNTKISVYKLFGLDVPDYLLVKSPLAIKNEKTLEDASGALKTIGELSQIAGNAAPTMVLSMLFPASALGELGTAAKILGKVATSSSVYSSAYGGAYAQARNEGKTDTEANLYGILTGTSEVVLGKVLEGLSKGGGKLIGKALGSEATTKLKTNISKAIASVIKNPENAAIAKAIIKNMGKEAAEEYFQYTLDPIIQNISFDGTDYTAKEIIENAFSPDALHAAWLGALSSGASNLTGLAVNGIVNKGGLLNAKNLNKLSDSDVQKVGEAITNAYAETVKADPNIHITDDQIEAYKKQSKKSMGSRENAIAQILIKTDELKSTLSNKIDEAKGKAREAGIDAEETASKKALQGDGDGGRIKESTEKSKAEILAENRANGKAFESEQIDVIKKKWGIAVEQITIRTNSGTKTRVDTMGIDKQGNIRMAEFKSSATAPLTKNQKIAFPEIYNSGGVVVGKGKGMFTEGYKIPTGIEIEIIRPK